MLRLIVDSTIFETGSIAQAFIITPVACATPRNGSAEAPADTVPATDEVWVDINHRVCTKAGSPSRVARAMQRKWCISTGY